MKHALNIIMFIMPGLASAQFIIPTSGQISILKGTQMSITTTRVDILNTNGLSIVDKPSSTEDTNISIQTPGTITNSNTFDFSGVNLMVELTGASQGIIGNYFIKYLKLNGDGVKNLNGNITVTDKLSFTKGILKPVATDKKFLFTGAADGISGGDDNSYYEGTFYSNGEGRRIFPVGIDGVYSPAGFARLTDTVGVQVINTPALLTYDTAELTSVNQDRYWEITPANFVVNSKVGLSLNGLKSYVNLDGGDVIVQAAAINAQAENLGSSTSDGKIIESSNNVTLPFLTIGKEKTIELKIHDLITPFTVDGKNDGLYIEKIDRYDHNTVTLLDRYGVLVTKWKDYTNTTPYDFTKLGPGNYICIVEYGNAGSPNKVQQQMITVLKTN